MPSPRTMPTRTLSGLFLAILALALSTGLPSAVRAATVHVTVGGASASFSPQTVNIQPGDTVVWTNAGGFHDAVADDGGFSSGPPSDSAWSFQHTFPAAGTFGYHCTVHGAPGAGMFGTVVVASGGTPGRRPAAPSNLVAIGSSTTGIALTWTDHANNETGFSIEQRTIAGDFQPVATVGPNATGTQVAELSPSSFHLFRVRALGSGGTASPFSNVAGAATLGEIAACVDGPTVLCLNEDRFRVEVDWRIPDGTSGEGQAIPLAVAPDSGLLYFFQVTNIEMLVKALNACGVNGRYWVFFAATTNVEFAVVVTDTETGASRAYYNPLGRPAPPVQDTNAFATCP